MWTQCKSLLKPILALTFGLCLVTFLSYVRYSNLESFRELLATAEQETEIAPYAHDFIDTNLRRFDVAKADLHYLKNFKSNCILEKLPDRFPEGKYSVYSNNAYVTERDYRRRNTFGGNLQTHMFRRSQGVLIDDEWGICGKQGKCRVRCLPSFMLLGMAKSGTSDFCSRISSHPLVYKSVNKELFYWTQYRFQLNATIGDYMDLFDNSLEDFIEKPYIDNKTCAKSFPYALGDLTSVTFTDDVWWREHPGNQGLMEPKFLKVHDLYSVVPQMKLIVILRNPSTRLYSSYNMFRDDPSPGDFHKRVLKSLEWWHNCTVTKRLPRRRCAYGSPPEMPPVVCILKQKAENNRWFGASGNYSGEIRRGMYTIYVKDWLSVFPKSQFLIIKTEEYSKNTLKYYNSTIFPFLDLPGISLEESERISSEKHGNSRSYLPMLQETRKILDEFYRPFNEELAEFLGDEKWLWKE